MTQSIAVQEVTDVKEVKTALSRMGIYYLLLAISSIPNAEVIPDSFPTRNVSAVYLLFLCVCLVLYYAHRVPPAGKRKKTGPRRTGPFFCLQQFGCYAMHAFSTSRNL